MIIWTVNLIIWSEPSNILSEVLPHKLNHIVYDYDIELTSDAYLIDSSDEFTNLLTIEAQTTIQNLWGYTICVCYIRLW